MKEGKSNFNSNEKRDPGPKASEFTKMDYYQRLGVSRSATKEEITKAFKQLSLKYHPDREGGDPVIQQLLGEAFNCLTDEKEKLKYDAKTFYRRNQSEQRTQQQQSSTHDPFAGFSNFDEWFKSRQGSRSYRKQEEAYQAKPKTPPDIKEVKKEAFAKVAEGSFFFKSFIEKVIREGSNAENLIKDPDIEKAIIKIAIEKVKEGSFFYNNFIDGWTKAGFNRKITDKDPNVVAHIRNEAIKKIQDGAYYFNNFAEGWKKAGFDLYPLLKSKDVHALIKQNLLQKALDGAYYYKNLSDSWGRIGFDSSAFMQDQDLINLLTKQAAAKKREGDYYYKSYIESWGKIGIEIK